MPEEVCLPLLQKVQRLYARQLEPLVKQYDISRTGFALLCCLGAAGNSDTVSWIARQCNLQKSAISQAAEELVQKGYLLRVPDARDRRRVHLQLTDAAKAPAAEALARRRKLLDGLMAGVTQEEVRLLRRVLDKMSDNLCRLSEEEQEKRV